ncbi:Protein TAPETUM DETERMINANT [Heracleum sosnowskyi]|uniref:Protein TAPETUM DETERMINANT n=1 Tax=Heracleum sosnowskyi TaxID=360622 RepID=A0AAD8MPJ5_9APIA|nr:Protein TAPETUM DETERMINANT [Heracleum sosnowskyi]
MSSLHISLNLMLLFIISCNKIELSSGSCNGEYMRTSINYINGTANTTTRQTNSSQRKLLLHGSCTNRDLSISQSRGSSSGIPQFIVQIVNTCVSGCAPSHIHLHCGWFASARFVNANTFKRLSFDDCLVNGGRPLKTSQIISFTYTNSFSYPIAFKSAKFC